jgi:hypothetical protein
VTTHQCDNRLGGGASPRSGCSISSPGEQPDLVQRRVSNTRPGSSTVCRRGSGSPSPEWTPGVSSAARAG